MAGLFRKAALERLSSPEQLDKAITVSSPLSWVALIGVTLIIAAAIFWFVQGSWLMANTGGAVCPDCLICTVCSGLGA